MRVACAVYRKSRTLSTTRDEAGRSTVATLVQHPQASRLFPVGRLDFHTDGLVLLTNDGDMAHRLTHPRYGVSRRYEAVVRGIWDAAQALQMPLNMHIFTGATPNHGLPFRQAGSPLAFAGVMFTIADLIQSGVCERYPGLKFVITEFETGWTAIMLKRLDWNYIRMGGAKTFGIPLKPSVYWKRQFYVTFEDDPIGIRTRDFIGTNTLLWGNDYPHGDSVFPHSQQVLNEVLQDCTPEERYAMTVKNVVQLYNLPFEV